jgi:hypothetical protein
MPIVDMKEMGLRLTAAILIDATIVGLCFSPPS